MYLIVEFDGDVEPSYLEFEGPKGAQNALDRFYRAEDDVVEFRNEWGEVLAVRRTAVRRIRTGEGAPDDAARIVARIEDLLILLGEPAYRGPRRVGWIVEGGPDEPLPEMFRDILVWSCIDPPQPGMRCVARLIDDETVIFRPCRRHAAGGSATGSG